MLQKSLYSKTRLFREHYFLFTSTHLFVCYTMKKYPEHTHLGFFRISSEPQTQVKTIYYSRVFWKLSRCDKEKANHGINGTDRHDNQEIAFNYFGCKHYTWCRDLLCQAMYKDKTSLATNNNC